MSVTPPRYEMHELFGTAHAVAALDRSGRVRDFTMFADPTDTIDIALGWFACLLVHGMSVSRCILLSAVRGDVQEVTESDLAKTTHGSESLSYRLR